MIALQLDELQLERVWQAENPRAKVRFRDVLTDDSSVTSMSGVYFELEPGEELATHTHDKDEIVILISGTGLGTVGEDSAEANAPAMVFVPAEVPHGFLNTGSETLRKLGILPDEHFLSTFEYELQPFGMRVFDTRGTDENS
jgi:quercetin dioxygenase-like cupin family protein